MKTISKKELTHPQRFVLGERVHVVEHGMGTVLGYTTDAGMVKVEFDSKNIKEFKPNKLRQRLVSAYK